MTFYPPLRDLHPSHRLTRDGVDDMTTWHRCAVCGATDTTGDGRLAEPCSACADGDEPKAASTHVFAPGDIVSLKSGGQIMTVCSVREGADRQYVDVVWSDMLEMRSEVFDPRVLTLVQPGAANG